MCFDFVAALAAQSAAAYQAAQQVGHHKIYMLNSVGIRK